MKKITIGTRNPALHSLLTSELPKGITIDQISPIKMQRDINFHGPLIEITVNIDTWQIAAGVAVGYVLARIRRLDKEAICRVRNRQISVGEKDADRLIEQEMSRKEEDNG